MPPVPSPEIRATIAEKLGQLSLAVETSPGFNRDSPAASGGLFHIWDFVKRTEYMLSEVEGIRQPGYEFKHAGQIKITKRGEAAAQELFNDTFTRSLTIDQLINGPPMMRNMMGMGGDIPPEVEAASKAVLEAFPRN
ncbi:hypothetical protein TASIC1_0013018300 [Trichoderma asperellum]|uniref:Uncharacterized protein n=1 Tax=Trichoderma asperellum TaxID=101201 RepID=A0A6V8R381_TRIAP|nr:hypothetical protein LI328DRAFT_131578 [Trichoderma asperelloides]GFP59487.1 hypothetical protein TASIC1_0013018300 [Trichoderma asperellum]